jgi:hypothetical protein
VSIPKVNYNQMAVELSPTQARQLGVVYAFLGSFLTLTMGTLVAGFTWVLWQNGKPGASVDYTGGPVATVLIYGLFFSILSFGVAGLKAGVWQIRHGRRDPSFVRWIGGVVVLCSVLGVVVSLVEFIAGL